MKKLVTLKLEIESDFNSVIYTAVGKLANELEDHEIFKMVSLTVDDNEVKPISLGEGLGSARRSGFATGN